MPINGQVVEAVVQTANGESIRVASWSTVVLVAIGLASLIVRQWGPWKKIANDQRSADLDRHEERIKLLEERLDAQAEAHQSAIAAKDALLVAKEAEHAAEISSMRHRMNNLDQCLTMLLMLIEQDPEKAHQAATRVREMRERQEATERAERATIMAARITAAAPLKADTKEEP